VPRKRKVIWTCRSCKYRNPGRKKKCLKCGKLRPKKRPIKHAQVLKELSYEDFIHLNGGDFCWICNWLGLPDKRNNKRHQRDHDHITFKPRGLLCYQHNKFLIGNRKLEEFQAAVAYLTQPHIL
jgi:hypothetical protein